MQMFDVGRMAQIMVVAAHAEGLASCPVTLHDQDTARAAAGVPKVWGMTMVIAAGWTPPDGLAHSLRRNRIPLDDLMNYDRFCLRPGVIAGKTAPCESSGRQDGWSLSD